MLIMRQAGAQGLTTLQLALNGAGHVRHVMACWPKQPMYNNLAYLNLCALHRWQMHLPVCCTWGPSRCATP